MTLLNHFMQEKFLAGQYRVFSLNVGALSAALTGLPTIPQDSPLACGVGVGAHSGSNALS